MEWQRRVLSRFKIRFKIDITVKKVITIAHLCYDDYQFDIYEFNLVSRCFFYFVIKLLLKKNVVILVQPQLDNC